MFSVLFPISTTVTNPLRHFGTENETQDPRKLFWDLFVGTMIVYSILLIPWRISFKQDAKGFMLYFDYFVDCVFGLDIIICFNAAYYEEVSSFFRQWKLG